MLRKAGQCSNGGGGGAGGQAGAAAGPAAGGVMGAEWSERFFYLSGHFLRYKKQSLNLTSVNLKQVRTACVPPTWPSTVLGPQSRFGDKSLKFQVVGPQNETAALKGLRRERVITGGHSKQNQMLMVKIAKYIVFWVYPRSYLIRPPVIVPS